MHPVKGRAGREANSSPLQPPGAPARQLPWLTGELEHLFISEVNQNLWKSSWRMVNSLFIALSLEHESALQVGDTGNPQNSILQPGQGTGELRRQRGL